MEFDLSTQGLLLIFLLMVIFSSRVVYHLLINFSGDFPVHLLFIREIRAFNHQIPKQISVYLPRGKFGYHCGVHWLLSFIPEKLENFLAIAYGPMLESFHALIIFCLIYFATPNSLPGDPFTIALFIAALTLLSPILNRTDGRGCTVNGRSAGNLFLNIAFFSMIMYVGEAQSFDWLVLALCSTTFLLLTSQFAFQAFFLFSLFIIILNGVYLFLAMLFVSMISAEIISCGVYHRFLWINTIKHKIMLFKYRNRYEPINRSVSIIKAIKSLPNILSNPRNTLEAIYRNPILSGFVHLPIIVFLLTDFVDESDRLWVGWGMAGVLTMLLTYLSPLRFLGEPQRYLEYITLPCSYIFLMHYPEIGLPHLAVITWFMAIQMLNYYAIWVSPYSAKKKFAEGEAVQFLKGIKPGNLLSIPTFLGIKIALYCGHKVVEFAGIIGSTSQCNDEFFYTYPEEIDYPNKNLSALIQKYDLDYIVLDLSRLILSTRASDYDLSRYKKIFENECMAVYSIAEYS